MSENTKAQERSENSIVDGAVQTPVKQLNKETVAAISDLMHKEIEELEKKAAESDRAIERMKLSIAQQEEKKQHNQSKIDAFKERKHKMQKLSINKDNSIIHKDSGATLYSLHDEGENNKFLGWCDQITWDNLSYPTSSAMTKIKGGVILVNVSISGRVELENAYIRDSKLFHVSVCGVSSKQSQRVVIYKSGLDAVSIHDAYPPGSDITKRLSPTVISQSCVSYHGGFNSIAINRCKIINSEILFASGYIDGYADRFSDSFIKESTLTLTDSVEARKAVIIGSVVAAKHLRSTERFEVINMNLGINNVSMNDAVIKKDSHYLKHTFASGASLYCINRKIPTLDQYGSNLQLSRFSVSNDVDSTDEHFAYFDLLNQEFCSDKLSTAAQCMIALRTRLADHD